MTSLGSSEQKENMSSEQHLSGFWVNTKVKHTDPYRILFFVILSISVISTLLAVVIIFRRKQHKTLASKNLFSLMASLMLYQLLMAVELTNWSPNYYICYTSAVISQFGRYGLSCWFNVLAFDIWRATFEIRCHNSARQNDQKLRYYYYCLYGWLFPAVVVAISIVIDNVSGISDDYKPGYVENNNRKCWLSSWQNFISAIIYQNIPEAILTIANCPFLLLGYCNTRKMKVFAAAVLHRKLRNRFCYYFQLSVMRDFVLVFDDIPFWRTQYALISVIAFAVNRLTGFYILVLLVWNSNGTRAKIKQWSQKSIQKM